MIFRQDAPSRYPVPQPQALPCAQRSTARAVSFLGPLPRWRSPELAAAYWGSSAATVAPGPQWGPRSSPRAPTHPGLPAVALASVLVPIAAAGRRRGSRMGPAGGFPVLITAIFLSPSVTCVIRHGL
jgi:hypothetical protein